MISARQIRHLAWEKMIAEITLVAEVNHGHVCLYHHKWIEQGVAEDGNLAFVGLEGQVEQ